MTSASTGPPAGDTGHRSLPHTADLRLEAWAPTRAGCLAEAVRALAEAVADLRRATPSRSVTVRLERAAPERQLQDLLDEVIYLLDAEGVLPVAVEAVELAGGAVQVTLGLLPVEQLPALGPAPKAVTLHGLALGRERGAWYARAVIDV